MEEKLSKKYSEKINHFKKLNDYLEDGFIHYYALVHYNNEIKIYSWHLKDKEWYILKKNLDIIKKIRTQILHDSYQMLGVKLTTKEKKCREKTKSKYKKNIRN